MKWPAAQLEYGPVERFVMRLLFALLVASHVPASLAHHPISRPNGLARLVDLGFLLDPQVLAVLRYALWAALVLYVLRVGQAVALPYMTLLSIAVGSVNNSHGAISHTFQILSLVLLAQTCAWYYTRFAGGSAADATVENRMVFWSQQAIVATYLASAITKLINSSGMWFAKAPLVAVQIVKTTDQSYYNMLEESARAGGLEVAEWIVQHPLLVSAILGAGFFLELLAPMALLGRRFALFFGVGLLIFHEAIDRVMKLQFAYNQALLLIYLVNLPFWIMAAAQWWNSRASRHSSTSRQIS